MQVLANTKFYETVNDSLGQTHNPASNDHYSHLKIVLFCAILKSTDGWTLIGSHTPRAKIVITTGRYSGSIILKNQT